MIWHIVRKDIRLLWPLAVGVAMVNFGNAALLIAGWGSPQGLQGFEGGGFAWIGNLALPTVGMIGLILLVVGVIHQDALPGTTQDWLTRPIPRTRLFAAKLLFVALMGLLPILLGDIAVGLSAHFLLIDALSASVTRIVVLLFLVCLPAALLALVTRKLTEVMVAGIGIIVALIATMIASATLRLHLPLVQSGYVWVGEWVLIAQCAALFAIVLPLQLRWRSTHRVRWILLAAVCVSPLIFFMPWDAALWVDRVFGGAWGSKLEVRPDDSRQITFSINQNIVAASLADDPWVNVTVPIVLSGVQKDESVIVDNAALRAVDARGVDMYRSSSGDFNKVYARGFVFGPLDGSHAQPTLILRLPKEVFVAARSAHATVDIDLSVTIFHRAAEVRLETVAVQPPDARTRCSRLPMGPLGGKVFSCISTQEIGGCFDIRDAARDGKTGRTYVSQCNYVTYAPWSLPLWRDAYYATIYSDPSAWRNVQFLPWGGDQSAPSDPVLETFSPGTHDRRKISVSLDAAVEVSKDSQRTIDGNGSAARFASPSAAVADRRGNMFIVDSKDDVIRKVTPSGDVSTLAGKPQQAGASDGQGSDARFKLPRGIAIDGSDNLYVADTGNGLIRKISPLGMVSTLMSPSSTPNIAPSQSHFNSPVAVIPAADGSFYVIESGDADLAGRHPAAVKKISPSGVVSAVAGPVGEDNQMPAMTTNIVEDDD